jgi:hypothetical protein
MQDKLAETGSRLANLNWKIMRDAAGHSLEEAFAKVSVLDKLADAWCTATDLRDKARKTLKDGSEDSLPLREGKPSVTLQPVVSIKCGPVSLPALTFDLELGAAVECAILVIANGKLAGIEAGTFTPFASLSYDKRELSKVEGEKVSLTRRYEFPNGGIAIPCGAEHSDSVATDVAAQAAIS